MVGLLLAQEGLGFLPPELRSNLVLYAALGLAVLVVLVLVYFTWGRSKRADSKASRGEDLSQIPAPAPRSSGQYVLRVRGQPGRVRLVVLAPAGKKELGQPLAVLNHVVFNLGEVVQDDEAQIRIWPPQLSRQGFAPTVFRHLRVPQSEQSSWVVIAGPARAGSTVVLIGLAILLDRPADLGTIVADENLWAQLVRVEV